MASEIVLPGLLASSSSDRPAAITVRRERPEDIAAEWSPHAEQHIRPDQVGLRVRRFRSADGRWHRLRFGYRHHFAEFVIRRDGSEVRACAGGEISDTELAALLEGVILGGALRLLGNVCLHATVLTVHGRAVALMGQSGAGKSSFALALLRQGCRLLSDDFAALDISGDQVLARPGRTRLRLWPDVVNRLSTGEADVERLYPVVKGLRRFVVSAFGAVEREPTRLLAIYLLNRRVAGLNGPVIEETMPGERLAILAANLYGSIDPGTEARRKELAKLAKVAAAVRVCKLTLPDSLDALPSVAEHLRLRLFD